MGGNVKLIDFPVPRNLSKRGMHGSASCYPEEGHWQERLAVCRDMGIGWLKFVDDGGASGLNVYRACWHDYGMIPIVRFYIGTPGQCGPREEDAIKRIADALGFATYFELCNEPDLPIEWNYEQPANWLYRAVDAYCNYAPKVLAAGGLPGTFALASGAFGQVRVDERGNEIEPVKINFLKLITDRIGTEIFNSGGWVSMHNYHINHPVAYPYDLVNQAGQQLTVAEYEAAPLWAWDNRPLADINAQRTRDQNPGDTIWDDDTCFGAYKVFLDLLDQLGLAQTPIITTEGGPTLTRGDDGRYPKTHIDLMVQLLEETYREIGPIPRYLAYCHWMLYNTTGGWATDCWLGGSQDYGKAITLFTNTPVGTWGERIGSEPTEPEEPEDPGEEEPVATPTPTVTREIDVPSDWGITISEAVPEAGEHYVALTKLRLVPVGENELRHNIYVDVLDQAGVRLYAGTIVAMINTGNSWEGTIPMEKQLPEFMGNYAMQKNDTINVTVERVSGELAVSDAARGMHTRHADLGDDCKWGHFSFELTFTYYGEYVPATTEEPATPEPSESLEQFIRRKTWDQVGVNYNPDAALTKYATRYGLGKPETQEFDLVYSGNTYRIQAFVLGIAFCVVGDWGNIQHIAW